MKKIDKENSLNECRKNKFRFDWSKYNPQKPKFTGLKVFKDISLEEISIILIGSLFSSRGNYMVTFPKF